MVRREEESQSVSKPFRRLQAGCLFLQGRAEGNRVSGYLGACRVCGEAQKVPLEPKQEEHQR